MMLKLIGMRRRGRKKGRRRGGSGRIHLIRRRWKQSSSCRSVDMHSRRERERRKRERLADHSVARVDSKFQCTDTRKDSLGTKVLKSNFPAVLKTWCQNCRN